VSQATIAVLSFPENNASLGLSDQLEY